MRRPFFILLIIGTIHPEIIHESGDLAMFLGGSAPSSAYENWVSHVSEGIASEGYNDYGPTWLDVQSNGFGTYRVLQENSPVLSYWETIFYHFVNGDTTIVDSLLQDSLESFFYEIVIFDDTTLYRTYHFLREQLDTSYVDPNQPDVETDDVVGSFRNGWGLFIINPTAQREQVLIQVPHPCDDFIAPYLAIEIFNATDAFGFMINGAGREVAWNEIGSYSNGKSISDPSRYPHTIFQKFQEAVTTPLIGNNPHWPLVFAIHSFDNATHTERKSVIIAAGAQNVFTNKPIRDITDDHFDIINFTDEYPIMEDQFGNVDPLHITDYYEAFYDDDFFYDNDGSEEFPIVLATELRGPSNGVQMNDLQSQVNGGSVYEPWVHVEMDEKPMLFDSLEYEDDTVYSFGTYPTGITNFSMIREYYQPFIQAVEDYLIHWETYADITAPDSIQFIYPVIVEDDQITLEWLPVGDTNFKTYQIQYGQDSLTAGSPIWDINHDPEMQNMRTNMTTVEGIGTGEIWHFRIRATDYSDNAGSWSYPTTSILPGHSPPDTILSFADPDLSIASIVEEDIDENSYFIDTINTMPGNIPTLALYGNTWKYVMIEPFFPDSGTVFHVYAQIDSVSEIQGIGFSDGENKIWYSIAGTETLDIESWIPVYQGTNPIGSWASYRFPIGNDWIAWYDTLSALTEIHFVNDQDDTTNTAGSVHFSMIRDLTTDLPISPQVSIDYSMGNNRIENNRQRVTVSFNAIVEDIDSYYFTYNWDFGDGSTSNEIDPVHEYLVEDDHDYTVLLTVQDESGQYGWASMVIQVDDGATSFPLTMNFVGDIMMGRRFEDEDGIITTQGVHALFEPTYDILGYAADITVANLEIPLTNQGEPHPTKQVYFRCAPENVGGLYFAGIDVVSLANNHIMDYMEPGMIQTQNILNEAGILHSGAGMDSYEAYLPAFLSAKGQTLAFIASSDRTGQYNNYQPYLNAGENKPGFAYLTPYYLKQQIQSVRENADLVVVEMHAGSEYSYSPGEDYDSSEPPIGFASFRTNPASKVGFTIDPIMGLEEEDYSPLLDRPKIWDRAIRHFAIDEGADIVIVHHPHIIQGVEIYNGKMIAHSLGNFIFDLNYPETYPSMILNTEIDETGFSGFSITPLYIDDYLTIPVTGELASYILDYIAMRSRELDTYVHVNLDQSKAYVIMDTLTMTSNDLEYQIWISNWTETELFDGTYFMSKPHLIPRAGSLSEISTIFDHVTHYRLGREKIWMKNFENEGSTFWNFNSDSEFIQDSIYRRGNFAAAHLRTENSGDNIITNLEERIPYNNELEYSIHGFSKTDNGSNVTLQVRLFEGRSSPPLLTAAIDDSINGTKDWGYYWGNTPYHQDARFLDIRIHSDIPDSGTAKSWFDDVGIIEWDTISTVLDLPISILNPNDYNYIQLIASQEPDSANTMEAKNSVIGDLGILQSIPRASTITTTAPGEIHFFDESEGPVGSWYWDFGEGSSSFEIHPSFYYTSPGIYNVNLTVTGLNGATSDGQMTIVITAEGVQDHDRGDINGDGSLTVVDVLLCTNYILGLMEFTPEEFLAADADGNGVIDIFDALGISDLAD